MSSGSWVPPVDIYQNGEHELVLKAELPDMTREDIDITVDNGTLTIKGEKKLSSEVKEEQFHRIERRYGAFSRSFLAAADRRPRQGRRRLQERRADHQAAAARGSQAAADQGRRRGVSVGRPGVKDRDSRNDKRQGTAGRLLICLTFKPFHPRVSLEPRYGRRTRTHHRHDFERRSRCGGTSAMPAEPAAADHRAVSCSSTWPACVPNSCAAARGSASTSSLACRCRRKPERVAMEEVKRCLVVLPGATVGTE